MQDNAVLHDLHASRVLRVVLLVFKDGLRVAVGDDASTLSDFLFRRVL